MDPIDLQIQNRLEKLKEKDQNQPIPSEDELYKRLRELKGLPATSSISNKVIISFSNIHDHFFLQVYVL